MTSQSYQQKLEAILDSLVSTILWPLNDTQPKKPYIDDAAVAITQLNLKAIGEDEKTVPNNYKDCHKQDARIALRAELRSIMAPETHIDRGSGFTHSENGNCPCLDPNAKEDTL